MPSESTKSTKSSELAKSNVYLISTQENITIFKIFSLNMSEGYGFMADIFEVFKEQKIDVGIVTTSQFEITTTTKELNINKLERVKNKLSEKYQVDVIYECSIVSIIADDVLHNSKIDKARRLILKKNIKPIHISVPSSNNLTWSFVVDKSVCNSMANLLHQYLILNKNIKPTKLAKLKKSNNSTINSTNFKKINKLCKKRKFSDTTN